VVLRDFSILATGHFGILATGVDNLSIDRLTIDTSRDGLNIDSCWGVEVTNCALNTPNDDSISLKASYALGFARGIRNVVIRN
jgi:polygalacturonase